MSRSSSSWSSSASQSAPFCSSFVPFTSSAPLPTLAESLAFDAAQGLVFFDVVARLSLLSSAPSRDDDGEEDLCYLVIRAVNLLRVNPNFTPSELEVRLCKSKKQRAALILIFVTLAASARYVSNTNNNVINNATNTTSYSTRYACRRQRGTV